MADAETFGGRFHRMFNGDKEEQPDPFLSDAKQARGARKADENQSDLPWSLWGGATPRPEEASAKKREVPRDAEVVARNGYRGSASENPSREREPRVYRERVLVRVYDLGKTVVTKGLNRSMKSYGAFHSGVEIYGREWSFGMTLDDWSTGITWNPPGLNPDHTYLETLSMGYTSLSPTQVWQIIEEMKAQWRGAGYHLLTRNCHHFSDAFCARLGVGGIPSWLNDLAGTGAATVEYLDSSDSGYDGGEAVGGFFSSMKTGLYNLVSWDSSEPNRQEPLPQPKGLPEQQRSSSKTEPRHDPFSVLRR